jgi:hypothetical protein
MSDERESTVSRTVLPVGESTRELFSVMDCLFDGEGWYLPDVMNILADADARDPFAVANLLYAWRTGQLA